MNNLTRGEAVPEEEKITVIEPSKPALPKAPETGVKIAVGTSAIEEPEKD